MLASGLPTRIKFMVENVVELRSSEWVPRRQQQENGPKTIREIHQEAAAEKGSKGPRGRGLLPAPGASGYGHLPPQLRIAQRDVGVPASPGNFQGMTRSDDLLGSPGGAALLPTPNSNGRGGGNQRTPGRQLGGARLAGPDEISLRPGNPRAKHMPPQHQPHAAHQAAMSPLLPVTPSLPFQPQLPSAPGASPRTPAGVTPVVSKKKGGQPAVKLTKEQLATRADKLLGDFLAGCEVDLADTVQGVRELETPSFTPDLLDKALALAADRKEADRRATVTLLAALHEAQLATDDQLLDAFDRLLGQVEDLIVDIPLVRTYIGEMLAQLVQPEVVSLGSVARMLHRQPAPVLDVALALLKQLHSHAPLHPDTLKQAGLDLRALLPAEQQGDDAALLAVVEKHGLGALYPALLLRRELDARMGAVVAAAQQAPEGNAPPEVKDLYTWLKEQPDATRADPQLVLALVGSLIQHITSVTTLPPDGEPVLTETAKKGERELVKRLAPLLVFLTTDCVDLQVAALYAVQAFSHSRRHPKGLILRSFMNFYDFDVAEDVAFKRWREEINDDLPGKVMINNNNHENNENTNMK